MEEKKTEEVVVENKTSQESEKKSSSEGTSHDNALTIIGYIIPFLFFVPLLNEVPKDKEFVRFHANQQLVLLLAIVVINILSAVPIIGWFIIAPLGWILILVWIIIGVINVANNEKKKLPIIGDIALLK